MDVSDKILRESLGISAVPWSVMKKKSKCQINKSRRKIKEAYFNDIKQ